MSNDEGLPIVLEELTLRRVVIEDRPHLYRIYSDPTVTRYEFDNWTADQVERLVCSQFEMVPGDPGVPLVLVSELQSENTVIGAVQLTIHSVHDEQGEIGFSFDPKFCGRGLATKSVNAALGYGFTQLSLHRIMAAVDVRNERSWHLMERIGMRREAHFLHDNKVGSEWIDDFVYAMLADEWHAKNP
jgi:RimJ/RimL family protein N-acetyltransferase